MPVIWRPDLSGGNSEFASFFELEALHPNRSLNIVLSTLRKIPVSTSYFRTIDAAADSIDNGESVGPPQENNRVSATGSEQRLRRTSRRKRQNDPRVDISRSDGQLLLSQEARQRVR
jgi:hypothetical protein